MIGSLMSRMNSAQNLDVNQLKQAIQDGTLPAYVGIPLMQDKMKQQQMSKAGQPQPKQPPIADQILAQANGIDSAQSNLPEMSAAEGGIMSYAVGGDVDPEDYEDQIQEQEDEQDLAYAQMMAQNNENQGIAAAAPTQVNQTPAIEPGINQAVNKDQARKYNVGNLRPSGFTYKGQVGVSPGGFAMFDSEEAGRAALNQDIDAKLKRGIDTPEKFIEIYTPRKSRGGDNPDKTVDAYIEAVAKSIGISKGDKIPNTPEARQALHDAIVRQEGSQYATAHFQEGGIASIPHFDGTNGSIVPAADYSDNPYMQRVMANQQAVSGNGILGAFGSPRNYNPIAKTGDLYSLYQKYIGQPTQNFFNETPEEQAVDFNVGTEARTGERPMFTDRPEDVARDKESKKQAKENKKALAAASVVTPTPIPVKPENMPGANTKITSPGDIRNQEAQMHPDTKNFGENQPASTTDSNVASPAAPATPSDTQATPTGPSAWDQYLTGLTQSREDLKSQKDEDKYLSLMAAGLKTLQANNTIEPGRIHSPLGDVATGGEAGLAYYANANKQRQTQENAIDKSLGLGLYRQEIAKATAGNKTVEQQLARDRLTTQQDQNAAANKLRDEAAFQNWQKIISAPFDKRIAAAVTDEDKAKIEQEKNDALYGHPIFRQKWKSLYPDLPLPSSGAGGAGWSITQK